MAQGHPVSIFTDIGGSMMPGITANQGCRMLKMKKHCQQCQAKTNETDLAFICSFECTFCSTCSDHHDFICPNCSGELLQRPRRTRTPLDVSLDQVKKKLFGQ